MTNLLATISAHKRLEVTRRRAEALVPRTRPLRPGWFRQALAVPRADGTVHVIAEIKQRSPSKGVFRDGLDHAALAHAYRAAGADALSVLADTTFFGGSDAIVRTLAADSDVPVLYKDVVVDAWQIGAALASGADAILLMVNVLGVRIGDLHGQATDAGLDVLVETHSLAEIAIALAAGATIIGVNARDFVTFGEDAGLAAELLARLPSSVVRVAESALRHPDDVARVQAAGADAVLIGEALVCAADPGATLRHLLGRGLKETS